MNRNISASVGQGGVNRANDVKTIQDLLNAARPTWGGPNPKLVVDGLIGPKTIGAIRQFQVHHFATVFRPDSKVDPGRRTIERLNEVANTREVPGASIQAHARGSIHPLIAQPSFMTCWATTATMLMSAHDNMSYPIDAAMDRADHNPTGNPRGYYRTLFDNNQGLPPSEVEIFAIACGMRTEPMVNFTISRWAALIRQSGDLGVGVRMPFLHIRVIIGMYGDGTSFGTKMVVHDPDGGRRYEELFRTFLQRYEGAAGTNNPQIFHY